MKQASVLIILVFVTGFCLSQNELRLNGFKEYPAVFTPPVKPCISNEDYQRIEEKIRINIRQLIEEGNWQISNLRSGVSYRWPLQQAAGFNDNSYYTISAYLDQDTDDGELLDYNCGMRTYDGHRGTDIALHPFAWHMMNNNQVEIIAAASGTIVYKQSGFADNSCNFDNPFDWNGLVIQHSDGTRTWYAHMQTGSITTKGVGSAVTAGEYLGRVGSSGASTGPHLHFEVDGGSNATLMDPFSGACNTLNATSCWIDQKPNPESTLNTILTHSAFPTFNACPTPTTTNESNSFVAGDVVFFGMYFHDIVVGQEYTLRIIQPGGGIALQNLFTIGSTQAAAFIFRGLTFPVGVTPGTWTVEVDFEGSTVIHNFQISAFLPVELINFNGRLLEEFVQLNWATAVEVDNSHFEIQRSSDGNTFYTIGRVEGQGTTYQDNYYRFLDRKPGFGNNFYRLKQVDFDGTFEYSSVVNISYQPENTVFAIGPNPFKDQLQIDFWKNASKEEAFLELVNLKGQIIHTIKLSQDHYQWIYPTNNLLPGMYFFRIRDAIGNILRSKKIVKME